MRTVQLEGMGYRVRKAGRFNRHAGYFRQKSRVTAVVGPVGVKHAYLGERRIALLRPGEVLLAERKVSEPHGETEFRAQPLQTGVIHGDEALHYLHLRGSRQLHRKRFRFIERCFS